MGFLEELQWRGMVQDTTQGTKERLEKGSAVGYSGFDPSAPSLHIGNLIPIMLLVHFQRTGNKPIALVGGATGMIGDPSGKSEERNLLSDEEVRFNQESIRKQLEKFLDFTEGPTKAEVVNNFDWFKNIGFLDFLRDVGKHLSINYMMAKDSVKSRLEGGISFTEFSYQLLQAYDFYWLYNQMDCVLQMGGSDQWGNITAGTELIRRKIGCDAYALTCPLLTRADGTKFGKTAGGQSVWLDPERTSPYTFYQYWLNCSDEDAPQMLRTFSLLPKTEIEELERMHATAPHERPMQKALARDVTIRVHSEADYEMAVGAADILFGKGTTKALQKLSERDFLSVFEGVPQTPLSNDDLSSGITVIDLVAVKTSLFSSKGEARRMIFQGGVSINKERITDPSEKVTPDHLLNSKYILLQKGKKIFHIAKAV